MRECPRKGDNASVVNKNSSSVSKTASAYVCDVTAFYSNTSDEDGEV